MLADLAARARRLGPLRASQLGRRPGIRPDPAETAAVAAWLVDAADGSWHAAGCPDPYTVVVVSADDGELARHVLALGPECLRALRYVLVDPDGIGGGEPAQPGPPPGMAGRLALEEPAFLYPPSPVPTDDDADPDEPAPPARDVGPLLTWLPDLPVAGDDRAAGLVVALGEVSGLPVDLFEWDGERWCELRLAAAPDGSDRVEEIRVEPGTGPAAAGAGPLAAGPEPGRYISAVGGVSWLRRLVGASPFDRLVVVDRWAPDGRLPDPRFGLDPGVRLGPGAAGGALSAPTPVPLDQLARVRAPVAGPEPVTGGWSAVTWRLG